MHREFWTLNRLLMFLSHPNPSHNQTRRAGISSSNRRKLSLYCRKNGWDWMAFLIIALRSQGLRTCFDCLIGLLFPSPGRPFWRSLMKCSSAWSLELSNCWHQLYGVIWSPVAVNMPWHVEHHHYGWRPWQIYRVYHQENGDLHYCCYPGEEEC